MFYERKIRYFDQYRDGERILAGGFARTEVRDGSFKLEIAAKCRREVSGSFPVLAQTEGGTRRIGEIRLEGGTGNFRQICHIGTGEGELPYFDMTGIQIPLSGTEELISSWKKADGTAPVLQAAEHGQEAERGRDVQECGQETKRMSDAREQAEKAQSAQKAERGRDARERAEERGRKTKRVSDAQERAEESGQKTVPQEAVQSMQTAEQEQAEKAQGAQEAERGRDAEEQPPLLRLREDKWEQLCLIYPHIHPFRDEREYLSVGPADFVLLSEKSYRAANNSFLLHGYYSYKHLILTRVEKRGEILYYIGVPGSYYEKEKQVAVMFGFESFECEEEPARYGDFGYYMMKVCI